MKTLNFGKNDFERIENAIAGADKNIENDNGWIYIDIIETAYEKTLYFEYDSEIYNGCLEFTRRNDEYLVFDNEYYEGFNADVKTKLEWLIRNFVGSEFTLTQKK